jgi:hypothetical protein
MLRSRLLAYLSCAIPSLMFGAVSLVPTSAVAGPCVGAPTTTQTKCVTAVQIPGNPLRSFDISWVNPRRAEMYFSDRSNNAVEVIDTQSLTFKRRLPGFVGVVLSSAGAVNNNVSGPDGVVSHGRWVYAGDGNSTLKVFDLDGPPALALKASVPTGGSTRVDEMALTSNGRLLLAANNAEDPPFATLFEANGNDDHNHVRIITRVTVDPVIMPANFGLSLEQPTWDPTTRRFYNSIPIIANNPSGCNYGQLSGPITCDGGVLVIDPKNLTVPTAVLGAFNPATRTGVIALHACGPNGSTVGPDDNILLGCTPQNNPSDVIQLVINAMSRAQTPIANITGSDEVFFNKGDDRYYVGASRDCKTFPGPCPLATQQAAVLGVIDARTNTLIETVPQGSGSHSVAADSKRNLIFVPQVAPVSVVGSGGDTTTVGQNLCGSTNGCVVVFQHKVDSHDHDGDHDEDDEVADNH